MRVIKLSISGQSKPMYGIQYPSTRMHGQYLDKSGFQRYAAWDKKRDATAFLNKLKQDAHDLGVLMSEVAHA